VVKARKVKQLLRNLKKVKQVQKGQKVKVLRSHPLKKLRGCLRRN